MSDRARARKLADRVRVVVAETLEHRVKDPRLGFLTITDARVTGDLREATVFYTVYGDESARAATAAALDSVKGMLRTEGGRQTGVRYTPSLAFVADNLGIESLRRFKEDATEVREGFECGIGLGSYNDIKVDDVIETFDTREIPRG